MTAMTDDDDQERLDAHVDQARDGAAASLVCRVENTRWPVSAAWMAISAVSASRISPTMMTSGSWRRIERRPLAKVSSIFGLTWIWPTPCSWYSTGSSMVMMFLSVVLIFDSAGVERGRLAAAGRAGDQDDAVRLAG